MNFNNRCTWLPYSSGAMGISLLSIRAVSSFDCSIVTRGETNKQGLISPPKSLPHPFLQKALRLSNQRSRYYRHIRRMIVGRGRYVNGGRKDENSSLCCGESRTNLETSSILKSYQGFLVARTFAALKWTDQKLYPVA